MFRIYAAYFLWMALSGSPAPMLSSSPAETPEVRAAFLHSLAEKDIPELVVKIVLDELPPGVSDAKKEEIRQQFLAVDHPSDALAGYYQLITYQKQIGIKDPDALLASRNLVLYRNGESAIERSLVFTTAFQLVSQDADGPKWEKQRSLSFAIDRALESSEWSRLKDDVTREMKGQQTLEADSFPEKAAQLPSASPAAFPQVPERVCLPETPKNDVSKMPPPLAKALSRSPGLYEKWEASSFAFSLTAAAASSALAGFSNRRVPQDCGWLLSNLTSWHSAEEWYQRDYSFVETAELAPPSQRRQKETYPPSIFEEENLNVEGQ